MSRKITFFGPNKTISQLDIVETVEEILSSDQTEKISVDEELWPRFSNAIRAAEAELGIILNTYEEEWIEGDIALHKFRVICQQAIGNDSSIDPYLIRISEMTGRLIEKQVPMVIRT